MDQGRATKRKFVVCFFIVLFPVSLPADEGDRFTTSQLEEIARACRAQDSRDRICRALIQVQEVGDDFVESVKAFVPLGQYEYFVLTVINFSTTGRLRFKPAPILARSIENTIDLRRDSVSIVFETSF